MSKEKDLLAEIEHQEALIAQATERLKALRVDVYALRRETLRNKKPTDAMLAVLAKLAAGDGISEFRPLRRDSLCPSGAALVSTMPAPSGNFRRGW